MKGGRRRRQVQFLASGYSNGYEAKPAGTDSATLRKKGEHDMSSKSYDKNGRYRGHSQTSTGVFGGKTTKHYGKTGTRTGSTSYGRDIFGGATATHYGRDGRKTGSSTRRIGVFGDVYTQHFDKHGRATGTSSRESGLFGSKTVHRDKRGNKRGYSR
jgi:hypothetical protein